MGDQLFLRYQQILDSSGIKDQDKPIIHISNTWLKWMIEFSLIVYTLLKTIIY